MELELGGILKAELLFEFLNDVGVIELHDRIVEHYCIVVAVALVAVVHDLERSGMVILRTFCFYFWSFLLNSHCQALCPVISTE